MISRGINGLPKVRDITWTASDLIDFEDEVKKKYEDGKIRHPIHLSRGNEEQLIEIFQYVSEEDWVFSSWRNHYHALLHGVDPNYLMDQIVAGKSMSVSCQNPRFYSSSIVGGIVPISLGAAYAISESMDDRMVWCFIGDMTFKTGLFHETHKLATGTILPIKFVVEDNNLSTNTPTDSTWGLRQPIPSDVVYYEYDRGVPHHGTGNWILF